MKVCVKYMPFILDFEYSNCLVKIQLARQVSTDPKTNVSLESCRIIDMQPF